MREQSPVCPHCGYVDSDAWEIDFGPGLEGDTIVACDHCGEEYKVFRYVSVSYSSFKC
jgi:hypothetical protein